MQAMESEWEKTRSEVEQCMMMMLMVMVMMVMAMMTDDACDGVRKGEDEQRG